MPNADKRTAPLGPLFRLGVGFVVVLPWMQGELSRFPYFALNGELGDWVSWTLYRPWAPPLVLFGLAFLGFAVGDGLRWSVPALIGRDAGPTGRGLLVFVGALYTAFACWRMFHPYLAPGLWTLAAVGAAFAFRRRFWSGAGRNLRVRRLRRRKAITALRKRL
ncbi:MAG: hypothetical protein IMW86_05410 [Hydrogenibacillus sp.]|nr:hypothetical protein [Hydrogenibacillus sp.]